jgi:hypothetical protein
MLQAWIFNQGVSRAGIKLHASLLLLLCSAVVLMSPLLFSCPPGMALV